MKSETKRERDGKSWWQVERPQLENLAKVARSYSEESNAFPAPAPFPAQAPVSFPAPFPAQAPVPPESFSHYDPRGAYYFAPPFQPPVFMPSDQPYGSQIGAGPEHDSRSKIESLLQERHLLSQQLRQMSDKVQHIEQELRREKDSRKSIDLDRAAMRKTEEEHQRDIKLYKAQAKKALDKARALEEQMQQEKIQSEIVHESKVATIEGSLEVAKKEIEELKQQQSSLRAQLSKVKDLQDELQQERELRQDLEQQIAPVMNEVEKLEEERKKLKSDLKGLKSNLKDEVRKRKATFGDLNEERRAKIYLERQLATLRRDVDENLERERESSCARNLDADDLLFNVPRDGLENYFDEEMPAMGSEDRAVLEEGPKAEEPNSAVMSVKGDPTTFFGSNIDFGIRK